MATRKLQVEILGDASSLNRAFGQAGRGSSRLSSSLRTLGKVAAVGVGAAFAGLAVVVKKGFDEIAEGQQVAAQTAAAIKSTGSAANVTAKQVDAYAQSLADLTGIDDEAVQAGENMLLTFTNIRNEVGKGNDIFNQATLAIADMATRMNDGAIPSGEQLSQTAIRVGKALNDPIKGMGALSRVGVQFTESQETAIKAMIKSGDTMGAQKLILAELTKEFGGSAKAAGDTLPGQLSKLRNSFDNVAAGVATIFLPALTSIIGFVNRRVLPALQAGVDWLGKFFGAFRDADGAGAKLGVVADAFRDLGGIIVRALGRALADVDAKLAAAFAGLNWNRVGNAIIDGIITAIQASAKLAKQIVDTFMVAVRQIQWEEVGKVMGPGLAAAIVTAFATLMDVGFWVRNWELAIAVAAVAFGGPIGRLAGKLLAPLTKVGDDIVVAIARAIEQFSPKLAAAFLRMMFALPALLVAPFRALENAVRTFFGRLGGLAVFTMRVLGLATVITALTRFVSEVAGILAGLARDAFNWAEDSSHCRR